MTKLAAAWHWWIERNPTARWRDAIALLLLVGGVALFFWRLVFTNLILARGDTFFYIYPYWSAASQALRAGRLPLWNPDLFMGAPFLANSQAGLLYPLNWPLWLLFDAPRAVSLSIVFHLCLAAGLGYGYARFGLGLRRPAAWLAAALYALGGYLTAQVEHVNQLQGLAWLPAVFWLVSSRSLGRARLLALGGVLGLQLLAGHSQAAFITVVGLVVYAGWLSVARHWPGLHPDGDRVPLYRRPIVGLAIAGGIALLLAAGQMLPTLELSQNSVRGGGLPLKEAISFSLNPLLLGRALLPGLGETLYSEYVAFLPLSALALAVAGVWAGRRRPQVLGLAIVLALGLFFALGAANPIYVALARWVPGFGLFRAPARWLALYALGAAGLAGVGLDALLAGRPQLRRGPLAVWLLLIFALAAWSWVAPSLTSLVPAPPESPIGRPAGLTLIAWSLEVAATIPLLLRRRLALATLPLALISLWLGSRALPYNHPTAPEAYGALRPATAYLKAATTADGITPPGRFLSVSDILFDPGDLGELASIYGDQLPDDAFYDLLVAIKQKEILAPNLPLAFAVPSADGYDGGVLPLANFVLAENLILAGDQVSLDGRLRENLAGIPDGRWLNLFNVRYVMTDKVGDAWADGVFFDLQHQAILDGQNPVVEVPYLPAFKATGLAIVSRLEAEAARLDQGTAVGQVEVTFADGDSFALPIRAGIETAAGQPPADQTDRAQPVVLQTSLDGSLLYQARLRWPHPGTPIRLAISLAPGADYRLHIQGLCLVDERDGAFQSLVVSSSGRYRLVYSGDVKIYENLAVLPRAFLVNQALWAADDQAALEAMQADTFDPAQTVVLAGEGGRQTDGGSTPAGEVTVVAYQPEEIELDISAVRDCWLVVSDSYYPGWQARLDGQKVAIERADLLFRAVPVPAGSHRLVMRFQPGSVSAGLWLSALGWLGWLAVAAGVIRRPVTVRRTR